VAIVSIQSVKRKFEDQLLRLPNVTGVGIGDREGREVLKVFVSQKVPESDLKSNEIIPEVLDGYETDVEEIGYVTAQTKEKKGD
jgi:hypothetical protein